VPSEVLSKPGPLDVNEYELVRAHTIVGARIVEAIPGLGHIAPAVRAGHERWDGRGYPDGLAGEEIPIAARVTFVCDAYDAMTSDRPYRDSLGHERACEELNAGAGTQFCARAVSALLEVIDTV
jgi:HD-GYP domain-containing protein (c-di-GMP phosphodiesterase class II)